MMQQMWASEGREHRRFSPCAATTADHLSGGRTLARRTRVESGERGTVRVAFFGLGLWLCLALGLLPNAAAQVQPSDEAEATDPLQSQTADGDDTAGEGDGREPDAQVAPEDAPATALSETDQRARALFLEGRGHHARGEMHEAAKAFEAAYRLSARPALCYNLHLVYASLHDTDKAAYYLERYLDQTPDVANRATLAARLQSLRARRAQPSRRAHQGRLPGVQPSPLHVAAKAAMITGGVGAVVFGTFAWLAPETPQGMGLARGDLLLIAAGSLGLGVAGGLVAYLLEDTPSTPEQSGISFAPQLSPSFAGVSAQGHF